MADTPGTLKLILRELATALTPLEQRLASENAEAFLRELGIVLPGAFGQAATAIENTAVKAGALVPLVTALVAAIEAEDAAAIVQAGLPLLTAIRDLIGAIGALGPRSPPRSPRPPVSGPARLPPGRDHRAARTAARVDGYRVPREPQQRPGRCPDHVPDVDDVLDPGDPADPVRPPLRRRALRLDRLVTMVTSPSGYLDDAFHFGRPGFDGLLLFNPLADFLDSLDLAVDLLVPPGMPPILEAYVLRLSTDPAASPPGLTAQLRVPATQDVSLTIPLGGAWSLVLAIGARFDAGIGAEISPPLQLRLIPPTGAITATASVGLTAQHPPAPLVLLGHAAARAWSCRSSPAASASPPRPAPACLSPSSRAPGWPSPAATWSSTCPRATASSARSPAGCTSTRTSTWPRSGRPRRA